MTATETSAEPLYLQSLQVENHLRIKFCRIDPKGRSIIVTGKNGNGKSSLIRAFVNCICGPDSRLSPEPVHAGARESRTVADFGDLKIERVVALNEKTGKYVTKKLLVTPSGGGTVKRPQELLDSMFDKCGRDPVKFLESRNQDQVDAVLGRAGVPIPVEQVTKLTSENQPPKAGESADAYLLRLSADETGLYYVHRRAANKTWEEKRNALTDQERHLSTLGGRPGPEEKEQSLAEASKQITALQAHQQTRLDALRSASVKLDTVKQMEGRLRDLGQEIDQLDKEQMELEAKLKSVQDKRIEIDRKRQRGQDAVEVQRHHAKISQHEAEAIPDRSVEIGALQNNLEGIEAANKKLYQRIEATKQVDRLAVQNREAEREHKRLDVILEGLREIRLHLLDGVDLGVPGLVIGDGGLRLDGVPFVQASMAQRIRVAAAVCMDPRARIKVMPIDELERLDGDSLQLLVQIARDNPEGRWELFGTRVGDPAGETQDGLHIEFYEDTED
jgi:hypothetical protein